MASPVRKQATTPRMQRYTTMITREIKVEMKPTMVMRMTIITRLARTITDTVGSRAKEMADLIKTTRRCGSSRSIMIHRHVHKSGVHRKGREESVTNKKGCMEPGWQIPSTKFEAFPHIYQAEHADNVVPNFCFVLFWSFAWESTANSKELRITYLVISSRDGHSLSRTTRAYYAPVWSQKIPMYWRVS